MSLKQIITVLLLATSIIASGQENKSTDGASVNPHANIKMAVANPAVLSGVLSETLDAGGYTYIKIMLDNQPLWAAGPVTPVNIGDRISFSSDMPMNNFYSKTLQRNFKILYFVDAFAINGKYSKAPAAALNNGVAKKPPPVKLKIFEKAENGQNVAEILENKDSLEGKVLRVRGQVSKFTANVMGKNWIHIRDNSSQQDLTVTTDVKAALNDIIVVEGQLVLNKDYGYGYVYDVLIEDAKLASQSPVPATAP